MYHHRGSRIPAGAALLAIIILIALAAAGCSRPYQPMKVLMIVGGDHHDYVNLPLRLSERLNERGNVAVEVTDDLAGLTAQRIEPYGVLVFNTCHRPPLSDELKTAVLRHVESGKGLVAVHCALWSYEPWPEWAEMLGGYVETHDKYSTYDVAVLDPAHVTMLGLGNRFEITDEPYLVDRRDPTATVLIETARVHADPRGGQRTGPEQQVWVKRHGQGRVFVSSFGHDEKSLLSEPIINLLHNGIRWAGGQMADTAHNALTISEAQAGFQLLFNGRDLTGWTGERGYWTVENGELVGSAEGLDRDTFLTHEREFSDFVLRLSVRLTRGNTGIQFRSVRQPQDPLYELRGYQADVSAGRWGALYDYGGTRRVLSDDLDDEREKLLVTPRGWNEVTIQAVGPDVTIQVNGVETARFPETDSVQPTRGAIGLQLHHGEPTEVRFRDLRIRPLGD